MPKYYWTDELIPSDCTAMTRALDPESLYGIAADLYAAGQDNDLLALLDREWPSLRARTASPHDAEACRLAFLAAVKLAQSSAPQWRARALSRFVTTGWTEGVSALLVADAFAELGRVNNNYPNGQFLDAITPAPVALAILDEAEYLAAGKSSGITISSNSPSLHLIARVVDEKRGFFRLLQGEYEAARVSYLRALDAAGSDVRGRTKVKLGIDLVNYVEALRLGNPAHASETEALVATAQAVDNRNLTDLIILGRFNAAQMESGSMHLKPYEIL